MSRHEETHVERLDKARAAHRRLVEHWKGVHRSDPGALPWLVAELAARLWFVASDGRPRWVRIAVRAWLEDLPGGAVIRLDPEIVRVGRAGHWLVLQGLHVAAFATELEAEHFALQLRATLAQAAVDYVRAESFTPRQQLASSSTPGPYVLRALPARPKCHRCRKWAGAEIVGATGARCGYVCKACAARVLHQLNATTPELAAEVTP